MVEEIYNKSIEKWTLIRRVVRKITDYKEMDENRRIRVVRKM